MAEPLGCADLTAAVVAQPAPVVFLDTAAILDVLRVPFRHELQADIIDSAAAVVNDARADQKRIWLVATGNVIQELGDRRQFVEDELGAYVRSLALSMSRALTVARTVFPEQKISSLDLLGLRIDQRVSGSSHECMHDLR